MQRTKKRKRFSDETRNKTILKGRDRFRAQVFYVICDSIVQVLQTRISCYDELRSSFQFFFFFFFFTDKEDIKGSLRTLKKSIMIILGGKNLENEFNHFRELCNTLDKQTISEMFATVQGVKATFPNISTIPAEDTLFYCLLQYK